MTGDPRAVIFDIQRFCVHDGPGIRAVVFFKGCTLRCVWCHNPEAVRVAPELAYHRERCLSGCRACVDVCLPGALRDERDERVDFARCTTCGACVDVCPAQALVQVGREMTVAAVLDEVRKDRAFYDASGGGVTLSGGEPVMHARFLEGLLPVAHDDGLHIALETAGAYPFAALEVLLPHLDLILFDLKLGDPARHARHTGRDNVQIRDNLGRLLARGAPLEVRMPVVPGINTDAAAVTALARLLAGLGVHELTLLPYNHLWEAKLPGLATDRTPLGIGPPPVTLYAELSDAFARDGVRASI